MPDLPRTPADAAEQATSRRGEPEQDAARRALDASEARYARLVELLPDGVITYDGTGRITFANAAAARLHGVSRPEDVVGQPVLDHVHPDSWASASARMERLARGEPSPEREERLVRADGTPYPAEVAAAPLGSGEVLVVVRDVTERRRVEAERTALEVRLRQAEKLEALGTLAGGVAHDFNNVLAAILGHADVLASALGPGDPRRLDVDQIAAAARRAKGVVQQILAFARRGPAELRPVDVARAVGEEMALLRAAMPASLELVPRIDPSAGAVLAEPTQLHQVLFNLCANARDAMHERAGVVEVVVARAELPATAPTPAGLAPGHYVRLAVHDTGPGMDEATRARAFEPYFTTKPVGGGSGLGLAVVHGVASALGGSVTLESAPGRGTTVEVWLPRIGDAAGHATPPPAPRARGSGRILLVDDDPPVVRALRRILERLGYEVTACGDGAEALALFRAETTRFDAVLTDETLPGMRGHQLTRELLALRPDLPVLICTGYSEHLDEERAREIGARGLFLKPFDVAQLGEALRSALAK
jgi:PAS domain S-box-containing protein